MSILTCGKCVDGYIRGATAEDGCECGCEIYICDKCNEELDRDGEDICTSCKENLELDEG